RRSVLSCASDPGWTVMLLVPCAVRYLASPRFNWLSLPALRQERSWRKGPLRRSVPPKVVPTLLLHLPLSCFPWSWRCPAPWRTIRKNINTVGDCPSGGEGRRGRCPCPRPSGRQRRTSREKGETRARPAPEPTPSHHQAGPDQRGLLEGPSELRTHRGRRLHLLRRPRQRCPFRGGMRAVQLRPTAPGDRQLQCHRPGDDHPDAGREPSDHRPVHVPVHHVRGA